MIRPGNPLKLPPYKGDTTSKDVLGLTYFFDQPTDFEWAGVPVSGSEAGLPTWPNPAVFVAGGVTNVLPGAPIRSLRAVLLGGAFGAIGAGIVQRILADLEDYLNRKGILLALVNVPQAITTLGPLEPWLTCTLPVMDVVATATGFPVGMPSQVVTGVTLPDRFVGGEVLHINAAAEQPGAFAAYAGQDSHGDYQAARRWIAAEQATVQAAMDSFARTQFLYYYYPSGDPLFDNFYEGTVADAVSGISGAELRTGSNLADVGAVAEAWETDIRTFFGA